MKPSRLIDQTLTPDGQTLTLHEHDGTYAIRIDGMELMSTRRHASEEKLAELACTPLQAVGGAQVLIGGLGFGYTLKAALAVLRADAKVVVAELLGGVVAWNRRLGNEALDDPRVQIIQGDVFALIGESKRRFDSIMMDVDNGAAAFTSLRNEQIYTQVGLQTMRVALKPNGIAAFWSAAANPAFERTLRNTGFTVETVRCRAHATSGGYHTIFVGVSR